MHAHTHAHTHIHMRCFHGLTGTTVIQGSIVPGFKLLLGYVKRVFQISLRLITIGGYLTHLVSHVHKGGLKTAGCAHAHTHTHTHTLIYICYYISINMYPGIIHENRATYKFSIINDLWESQLYDAYKFVMLICFILFCHSYHSYTKNRRQKMRSLEKM